MIVTRAIEPSFITSNDNVVEPRRPAKSDSGTRVACCRINASQYARYSFRVAAGPGNCVARFAGGLAGARATACCFGLSGGTSSTSGAGSGSGNAVAESDGAGFGKAEVRFGSIFGGGAIAA